MPNFKKILLMALLSLAMYYAKADVGCKSNASNWLYYTYTGMVSGYPIYEKTPRVDFNSVYCPEATGATCYIRTTVSSECSGCPFIYPYYYQQGTQYNFSFVQCPIDDYVGLMLVVAGGIGVFFLRGRIIPSVTV